MALHPAESTKGCPAAEILATSTGSATTAEQPKEAEARPSASSLWELSAPKPLGQLDNMALAGVPLKPRCKQCNCLLDNGCCVEPDCSMFLVESAMEDGQPVETEPPKAGEQAMEAEPPMAEQPEQAKEAEPPMAEQRASSQWELSAPKPPADHARILACSAPYASAVLHTVPTQPPTGKMIWIPSKHHRITAGHPPSTGVDLMHNSNKYGRWMPCYSKL